MVTIEIEQETDGTYTFYLYKMYKGNKIGCGFGRGYATYEAAHKAAEQDAKYCKGD